MGRSIKFEKRKTLELEDEEEFVDVQIPDTTNFSLDGDEELDNDHYS